MFYIMEYGIQWNMMEHGIKRNMEWNGIPWNGTGFHGIQIMEPGKKDL
jgi:hypothetical protein